MSPAAFGPPVKPLAWPPPALTLPDDLIQPVVVESHIAYYRPTVPPFYFLHSSHLPPGTTVETHCHPCVALHGCLRGPLTLTTPEGPHELAGPGAFFLIAPGAAHGWHNAGAKPAANLSVLIDHRDAGTWPAGSGVRESCQELLRRVRGVQRFDAANDRELKSAFWAVVDHLMADRPRSPTSATGALLSLLGRLVECVADQPQETPARSDAAEQMRRLLLARIEDRLTIEEVARHVCLSSTRAKQLFRATYGCGIMAYFNHLKIWHARRLLGSSGLSVEQVSRKLGFSSPSYFSRVFRRVTGESPSDFR